MPDTATRAGAVAGALASAEGERSRRFTAWPLWGSLTGLLATVAVLCENRPDNSSDFDYPLTAAHVADLDNTLFRVGGVLGYAAALSMLVFAAIWNQRVSRRFTWSTGATVVGYGLIASAAVLTLAAGWRGALGLYLPDGPEGDTYDPDALFNYFVMNDFSPYIAGVPLLVSGLGIAWMAFAEKLVSRPLGAAAGFMSVALFAAVVLMGVPGLPFAMNVALVVAGVWLAVGRSAITQEPR
jgi:hypothetical protein